MNTRTILLTALLFLHAALLAQPNYAGPSEIPAFTFTTLEGAPFTRESLVKGKPVIVMFFDPTCEHCQQQSEWIAERMQAFSGINLLFVTWGKPEEAKNFRTRYYGDVKPARGLFTFTLDKQYKIDTWFGDSPVPSIHIFGKDWKHTQSFFNETAVEEMLKWAEK